MNPMKVESQMRAFLRDCHGPLVWAGVTLGTVGYIALEWSFYSQAFGAMMFLGGFRLGIGYMQNRLAREAKQSNPTMQTDLPPADR